MRSRQAGRRQAGRPWTCRGGFLSVAEFMSATVFYMAFFLLYLSFARLYLVRDEVRAASRAVAFAQLRENQQEVAGSTTSQLTQRINQPGQVFHAGQQGTVSAGGGPAGTGGGVPMVQMPMRGPIAPLFVGDQVAAGLHLTWLLEQVPGIMGGVGSVSASAQAQVRPIRSAVGYPPATISKGLVLDAMPWDARTDSTNLYERVAPKLLADKANLPGTGIVP